MRVARRHPLSKRDKRRLAGKASALGLEGLEDSNVEVAVVDGLTVYIVDGVPCLFEAPEGRLAPTLHCLLKGRARLPRVLVDRGAARAVARGADLMAPGVVGVEGSFQPGDLVAIADSETGAPVAVGVALKASSEIEELAKAKGRGRVVENIHHPGDEVWEAAALLR